MSSRRASTRHLVLRAAILSIAAPAALAFSVSRLGLAQARSTCPAVAPANLKPARQPCGVQCGLDRWAVKTLNDRDLSRIKGIPISTTVESLSTLKAPRSRPTDRRVAPAERRLFCVEAWFVEVWPQTDRDLHVMISGLADTTSRMIVEIPSPDCLGVCGSGLAALASKARQKLERRLATWTTDTLRIRVLGVGFFDRNHGQIGAAPNYIELHPVLAVDFP
jgi:hypothetical protein